MTVRTYFEPANDMLSSSTLFLWRRGVDVHRNQLQLAKYPRKSWISHRISCWFLRDVHHFAPEEGQMMKRNCGTDSHKSPQAAVSGLRCRRLGRRNGLQADDPSILDRSPSDWCPFTLPFLGEGSPKIDYRKKLEPLF